MAHVHDLRPRCSSEPRAGGGVARRSFQRENHITKMAHVITMDSHRTESSSDGGGDNGGRWMGLGESFRGNREFDGQCPGR